jgi:hypothetical protein
MLSRNKGTVTQEDRGLESTHKEELCLTLNMMVNTDRADHLPEGSDSSTPRCSQSFDVEMTGTWRHSWRCEGRHPDPEFFNEMRCST